MQDDTPVLYAMHCLICSKALSLKQVFYPVILLYMIAAFLQGGPGSASMGLLNNLRSWLWIPVAQDAFR